MEPLVSILIPAYNAEKYVAQTLQSAIAQTWPRKEIIVINDGSTDGTEGVIRQFASKELKIVSTENQGLCAAVNHAYRLCQGDYIQELDSDDLLAPDKIELQLKSQRGRENRRILLSSPWAHFYFRPRRARFVPNALWNDLSPVEWLLRKMGNNLHMQNATWLVSREIADAAGPWDETLQYDQDGEYFCRVLLASEGTRFVGEGRVFYRDSHANRISYIGKSDKKRNSLLYSMKLHIRYIRSLEDSERVRRACVNYIQNWLPGFYPDRTDILAELQILASELGGELHEPRMNWKYEWMKPLFGLRAATWAQRVLPETRGSIVKKWDEVMFDRESKRDGAVHDARSENIKREPICKA